ncbi:MAG: TIGR00730 family Rossman fold protein [Polyangiaceae bacterium]
MRSVCVFCGSRPGADPAFGDAAEAFGRALAARGIRLVYGGASVGLMGTVADAVLAAGGQVTGVIPKGLVDKEIAHAGLPDLRVTADLAERKAVMIAESDAFVALPGGFGTYDELFETLTMAQIGLHALPNGLLDVNGFFEPFVRLIDHTIEMSFAPDVHRGLLVVEREPEALLDALAAWTPPPLGKKWTDRRGTP